MSLHDTVALVVETASAAESLPDPTTVTNRTHKLVNTGAATVTYSSTGATPFTESGINVASITIAAGSTKEVRSNGTRWEVSSTLADVATLQADDATMGFGSAVYDSMPRGELVGGIAISATGGLRLTYFNARQSGTVTNVSFLVVTAQVGMTFTVARVGLYLIEPNGDGTLVASTTHDATLFNTLGVITKALTASYAMIKGRRYAIGFMPVYTGAGTTPAVAAVAFDQNVYALDPRMTGFFSGQANLPASFVAGSVSTTGTRNLLRLS